MVIMTKPGAIIKIQLLQNSQAKNYFESKERLLLKTLLAKLQNSNQNLSLTTQETDELEKIYKKYKRFL